MVDSYNRETSPAVRLFHELIHSPNRWNDCDRRIKTFYLRMDEHWLPIPVSLPESLYHAFSDWLRDLQHESETLMNAFMREIHEAMLQTVACEDPDLVMRYEDDKVKLQTEFVRTAMEYPDEVIAHTERVMRDRLQNE